jgi:tetratricopeptide (TPR) repeat protein
MAVLLIASFTACKAADKPLSAAELLDLGEKYLLEMNYEQAVVQFTTLIEVEPKNARAYLGAAEAYVGLGKPDKAIEVLRQGLEQLPGNAEIIQKLDALIQLTETPQPTAESILLTLADYEKIYTQYMDSKQWQVDYEPQDEYESTDMADYKITAHKIFDLDGNGIPELWFHAEASDEFAGPRGPERRDFFCAIQDSRVIQLLSGYISGGSIGGDEISILYDTEEQTHVVCKTGYAGGFGGSMSWIETYHYADGIISKDMGYSVLTQIASNYADGELDDPNLYYEDSGMTVGNEPTFTVYKVNDVQVKRDVYEKTDSRFTDPITDEFKLD